MKRLIKHSNLFPHRDDFIIKECRGKNVLHIGACDWPFTEKKFNSSSLLFQKIDAVCSQQLGVDMDKGSIDFLNSKNLKKSKLVMADMNDSFETSFDTEVIIFADTLEHLSNAGVALESLKNKMSQNTKMILTVPNAFFVGNFMYSFLGREAQHPDHKAAYTPKTLTQLLTSCEFHINELYMTYPDTNNPSINLRGAIYFAITKPLGYIFPMMASTLMVVCKKNKQY